MYSQLLQYVWLIPLLPLLAAAWIAIGYIAGCNRGEAGERQTSTTATLHQFYPGQTGADYGDTGGGHSPAGYPIFH